MSGAKPSPQALRAGDLLYGMGARGQSESAKHYTARGHKDCIARVVERETVEPAIQPWRDALLKSVEISEIAIRQLDEWAGGENAAHVHANSTLTRDSLVAHDAHVRALLGIEYGAALSKIDGASQ